MAPQFQTQLIYQSVERGSLGEVWRSGTYRNPRFPRQDVMRVFKDYCLNYIIEGQCSYVHEDQSTRIFGPGDLFFLFPNVPHFYGAASKRDWVHFYITFNGPVFDAWREAGVLDPKRLSLHLEPINYWLGRMKSVVKEVERARPTESAVSLCIFQLFLAEAIAADARSKVSDENAHWLERAKRRLSDVQQANALDLKAIADELCMSYSNFRKKFARMAKMPPAKFHAGLMMKRACQWMHAERITNSELADRLGYCKEFHFSQRFQQIVGVSPRQYRQSVPTNGD